MKKIGIITLNGYINYGNRLQNYALQEVLKSLNLSVETIRVVNINFKKNDVNTIVNIIRRTLSKGKKFLINKKYKKYKDKRIKIFKDFSNYYISETNYIIDKNNTLNEELEKFDYFVTGSDQVWNPYYNSGSSIYFLEFAPTKKRLTYAPSFGINTIPSKYVEDYKRWIQQVEHLSVREDDGAKIIKELTGRDAPVHVDPTLLLTKEEWINISREAKNKPKGKYLLTYFLGGVPDQYKKQVRNITKENNLEVINLGDISEKETYITGPCEFVDYINNCSVFCTDSFHGAVFSILFEKPFIIYERLGSSSMYSRIDTLLNTFDLNSRKAENINIKENAFEIDFSHVPSILNVERKKAIDYLKNCIKDA